ncbi:hypothetical protein ABZ128_24950 [Streptomyces sp. NPDC006326]|uniref:hypothetical protein n=1 Tax=Streptomyces sp. NPDC006326 TaxID=3156752 RepID=UPI0033B40028
MGFTRTTAVAVAAAAALAALTAPAGADTGDPAPAHRARAASSDGPWEYCGTGWYGGLAVHTQVRRLCPTALQVAQAFHGASQQAPRRAEEPVTVRVDDVPWRCETREGSPNPYIACVNQNDRSEEFQLNS